jgi:hypothetical protein
MVPALKSSDCQVGLTLLLYAGISPQGFHVLSRGL